MCRQYPGARYFSMSRPFPSCHRVAVGTDRNFAHSGTRAPGRHRNREKVRLSFEELETRWCLSADAGLSTALPVITEQQALAMALNDIAEIDDGIRITSRRHHATL